ncbi:MAG TPA: aldehyde dehydrogenase family protein, partial [Rhodoglobus sp.]|nr:aldehyde dehydrogenase family protein [Rhodoglobus sp.]
PVLSITTFTDEADAVAKANDTEYGLVSYVYTQDFARGQRLIETLQTGMMGLNVGVVSNAAAPFGGMKQSGVGREGGFEGIHEYLETKYVLTPNPFA